MSCNTRVIRSNVIQFELIGLFIKTKVAEEGETIRLLEFEKELELLESKELNQIGYYRKDILQNWDIFQPINHVLSHDLNLIIFKFLKRDFN